MAEGSRTTPVPPLARHCIARTLPPAKMLARWAGHAQQKFSRRAEEPDLEEPNLSEARGAQPRAPAFSCSASGIHLWMTSAVCRCRLGSRPRRMLPGMAFTDPIRLEKACAQVIADPEILSGTPVIKGTRVPVYDVAASVAAGVQMEEILSSYPSLNREQVELAALYAEANPAPVGRARRTPPPPGAKIISSRRKLRSAQ
jgi:uncharacterized protein (DUF433 family)